MTAVHYNDSLGLLAAGRVDRCILVLCGGNYALCGGGIRTYNRNDPVTVYPVSVSYVNELQYLSPPFMSADRTARRKNPADAQFSNYIIIPFII